MSHPMECHQKRWLIRIIWYLSIYDTGGRFHADQEDGTIEIILPFSKDQALPNNEVFVCAELFVGFKYRFCTLQVFLINEIKLFMFISVK